MTFSVSYFLKSSILVGCICFLYSGFSQTGLAENSYFNHLYEVNKEWANHKDACPDGRISFKSDVDRIQAHLDLVILHLRQNTPGNLTQDQKNNRTKLLDDLADYAHLKTFPTNTNHDSRTPYFVDNYGVHCAVGQLMHVSGHDDLVARIKQEFNYSYLADISTDGVREWSEMYGFTIDELKWIQPGYSPSKIINAIGNGSNGPIKKLYRDTLNNRLIISGNFDTLNQLPCLNIGKYKNDQLSCIGSGLDGVINDIKSSAFGIIAFGQFNNNGITYPLAHYNGSVWAYYGHPLYPNAFAQSGFISDYYSEISIQTPAASGQEIWSLDFVTNMWEKIAGTNGVVLDIIRSDTGQVYVGHFDTVITLVDTIPGIKNVIIYNTISNNWFGLGSDICDTVKVVKVINGNLFFAGACSMPNNPACITKYAGDSLNILVNSNDITPYGPTGPYFASINTLFQEDQNNILFGGNCYIFQGFTYGYHFGKIKLSDNTFRPLANFNKPVNSISIYDSYIFVGGDFTADGWSSINYLGKTGDPASTDDQFIKGQRTAFPNPFSNEILLQNIEPGTNFNLVNQQGQTIRKGIIANQKIEGLSSLPNGIYYLQLTTAHGMITKKMVKK